MALKSHFTRDLIEAGCDEAGRGCLAGPVYAAAVILPRGFANDELTDSKLLTRNKRERLRKIIEDQAIAWAVASVGHEEIDRINILNASILAMHNAIELLSVEPGLLLIDGNRFLPYPGIVHQCIVKGDSKYLSIAAASVLAKTYRDEYMEQLHTRFPQYGWDRNKGYPSQYHRNALNVSGPSPVHRMTFKLL